MLRRERIADYGTALVTQLQMHERRGVRHKGRYVVIQGKVARQLLQTRIHWPRRLLICHRIAEDAACAGRKHDVQRGKVGHVS